MRRRPGTSGKSAAISAHRAEDGADPESYASYRAAIASGADYVEIDVRATRDGVLVARHDEHGPVSGKAIEGLDYGELCDEVGYRVPQAAEVMGLLAGQVAGHLDLKAGGYELEAVGAAREAFGPEGFVVTTLEDASAAQIREAFPDVRVALSLGRELGGLPPRRQVEDRLSEIFPVRRARACAAQWVALDYRLAYAGVLGRCAAHGIGAMVWTVNSDRLLTRFLRDPRVEVVITDRPARARELSRAL